ncbi:MAG: neutral zinc metallopeptidase [Acidimicrobiales bacterium]
MRSYRCGLAAVGAALVLVAACAQEATENPLAGAPIGDGVDDGDRDRGRRAGDRNDGDDGGPAPADDPDAIVERAIDDVRQFWAQRYPDVYGGEFRELAGFYGYGPDTELPPCGPVPLEYPEIADNAFYCPSDDIIAWDESSLIPALNREFGAFTVAIVFAHEFAHAVQQRAGAVDRTVDLELQADCFAGAWTRHVADGDSANFQPGDVDLDQTVAGMIAIRDVPGTSADDPMAHGSGFDRIGAFQEGYEGDVETCAGYADPATDLQTVEIPFTEGDFETGGNLQLDDFSNGDPGLLSLVESDLNEYYDWLFGELGMEWTAVGDLVVADASAGDITCGGETRAAAEFAADAVFCEDENQVVIGNDLARTLHRDIGDYAVAAELGRLWAQAAQSELGTGTGTDESLQADCLTGAWAASTFPGAEDVTPTTLQISAGDLDEGIMGFIAYSDAVADDAGTAFERTDALRTGVVGGYAACEEYGELG